ncbi:MAG: hypothetical protein HN350_16235, partial [Phycisphaerales bacterium]|nr:hypothetical protein [Phycisphaerales bacterium]
MKNLSAIFVAILSAATALGVVTAASATEPVSIAYRHGSPQLKYAAGKLAKALK